MAALVRSFVRPHLDRIAGSELGSRLASGAFWAVLGGVSAQLLTFTATVCVARILGREQFGEFGMIRSTAMMGSLLAAFGIGLTATKHVAEYRRAAPDRAGRVVVLAVVSSMFTGCLTAFVLYVLAAPLTRHALQAPHLVGMIRLASLLVILNTVIIAQTGALAGFEAFKTMTRAGVVAGFVSVPILVVATFAGGLQGAICGAIFGLLVHCILNHRSLWHEASSRGIPLSARSCFREWKTLGAFSLPAALSNMVTAPATWIGHALLVNQTGGYSQMGIFNVASQWQMAILFVPHRICLISLPVLSSLTAEGRLLRFRRTFKTCVLFSAGAALLVAAPVILLSPWIMRVYGSDFVAGAPALSLLAMSAVLMSVNLVLERAVASLGRVWLRFCAHFLWSAVLLTGVYALVTNGGGAAQLALAILLACAVNTVVLFGFLLLSLSRHDASRELTVAVTRPIDGAHDDRGRS